MRNARSKSVESVPSESAADSGPSDSETRYRTLVEAAREIICTVALDGRFTSFNRAFHVLTGWSSQDWIGRRFNEIVHPDDLSSCVAAFEVALKGEVGSSVRHRLRTHSGDWLRVESTGAPLFREGRVVGVLGLVRDVTARVEAEQALFESRRRLAALFENALDAILLVDDEGRYVDANPAAAELLGYELHELLGLSAADVIAPGYEAQASVALRTFAERGRYVGDYRLRRKDGTIREAEFRSVANILPGLHLAIVRDVTDRKRAEEELRQSRRRLEEAEEVAHVGCWEWDLSTGDLTWTAEMYRLFGASREDFRPNYDSSLERVHPDDRAAVDAVCKKAVAEGRDYAWDARIVRPSGEVRFLHARGHAVRNAAGEIDRMIGIAQDVTERTRDEQVRRALMQRLISVHEEERARVSRELHDGTGQSLAALLVGLRHVEGAASLKAVRLAAARQRELVAQTLDEVGRLARGLRPTALDDLGLKAALERHASDQAWLFGVEITLDATGLGRRRLPREIETALYRAAQEAIANAGRHAEARRVRIRLERQPLAVRLTVSDDGRGFDVTRALEAHRRLGLHTIRERAELLGGRAEISSSPGQGTRVSLVVPVPAPPPTRPRATRRPSPRVRRATRHR
jgi:PAS domain S-box-containing protein